MWGLLKTWEASLPLSFAYLEFLPNCFREHSSTSFFGQRLPRLLGSLDCQAPGKSVIIAHHGLSKLSVPLTQPSPTRIFRLC